MSLPSTVDFAAGDTDYITKLDQLVTDMNAVYAAFLATTSGALFSATSTTSATVGTGTKGPFTLAQTTQRAFAVGQTIRVADSANTANYMEGTITAYDYSNLSAQTITVSVSTSGGSGTKTAWTISLAAGATAITSMGVGTATASQFIMVNSTGNAIEGVTAPLDGFADVAFWMGSL